MDKTIIKENQLKTSRQKKRKAKTGKDKDLLRKYKRLKSLKKEKENLEPVPLATPYQHGWNRTFILRDDIANSSNAEFFQHILNKINTRQWSRRKDFLIKCKRKSGIRNRLKEKEQKLKSFHEWEFKKLNLSNKESKWFICTFRFAPHCNRFYPVYTFSKPWLFTLQISPNIITHHKRIDSILEQEIAWLDDFLFSGRNCGRINKIFGRSNYNRKPRYKIDHRKKSVIEYLNEN